ncbi:MAG: hypothetical protein Kow00120_00500 [Anaerolineae bacterium]
MSGKLDMMRQGAARWQQRSLDQISRQAAEAQAGRDDSVVSVRLEDITLDAHIQVRTAGLDQERVRAYALAMEQGTSVFPPVDLFLDGDTLYMAAGFHRYAARQLLGAQTIEAVVRPGGFEAAVEWAERDNLAHGLGLTNADKRHILTRRMARGHEWAQWSNRRLAAALGVSEGTIRNWRDALDGGASAQNYAVAAGDDGETGDPTAQNYAVTRIGADGREYDVRNIQAASRARPGAHGTPAEPVPTLATTAQNYAVTEPEDDQRTGEQVPVLVTLQDFVGQCVDLAKLLEDMRDGREHVEGGFLTLVEEALDHLNGYENARGQWVPGVNDLLAWWIREG